MADYLPRFKPGQTLTLKASAAVSAGQVVEVSGDLTVAPAGAASLKVVGVAGFDAAAGVDVTVHTGGVQRLVASGAVAAGDKVDAAAGGKAAKGTTAPIGLALQAAANGAVFDALWI